MFGNYQSSNQANIANNNVDTKVSNSTTNLTLSTMTAVQRADLENDLTVAGNMNATGNCALTQQNVLTSDKTQNLSSIATTNTSFDNTLSTNITNDLKADLQQSTPGLSGGYLSAQMNNQVNSVSNEVQNSIRNASYISRSSAITSLEMDRASNTWHIGGDFTCSGDASFSQGNTVSQKSFQDLKTKTNDAYTVTNDITTTLDNTLSTSASQAGSIMMYVAIVAVVYVYYSQEPHESGADVYITFIKIAAILTLFHWELIQYIHGRDPTNDDWYAYWNKSYMWTQAVPTSWIPDFVADNSFGLFETPTICTGGSLRGMAEKTSSEKDSWQKKCVNYYDKVSKWKDTWQDLTIRNDISINGEGGVDSEDRKYDCDISGESCKICDFPLVDNICQKDDTADSGLSAAQKDFRYEELLKISLECAKLEGRNDSDPEGTYVDFSTDMMSYHHEVYLWDDTGTVTGGRSEYSEYNNKKPVLRHDPDKMRERKEESVQIIQPGVGYLTGSDYKTECKRMKTGTELQAIINSNANKTGGQAESLYEDWGTCCEDWKNEDGSPKCADTQNITVSLRGDSSCSSNTAAINDSTLSDDEPNGMGCWRQSTGSNISGLLGDLALTTQGVIDTGIPMRCEYDGLGGIGQAIAGTIMHCDDDKESNSCTTADNCSANFLTKLVQDDNGQTDESNVNMNPNDILTADGLCPGSVDLEGKACGFSVGGVTNIIIENVPENHLKNPNNMYKIVTDDSGDGGKQIYIDPAHRDTHSVIWAKSLAHPPDTRSTVKGSLGIWSTSAAIQTSSFDDNGTAWVSASSGPGGTICRDGGGSHIHESRKWPEMGNPCESTFKLNPLVTETTVHDPTRDGKCTETAKVSVPENKRRCEEVSVLGVATECEAVKDTTQTQLCTYTKPGTIIERGGEITMGCGAVSLEEDLLTRCQCEPIKGDGDEGTAIPINIIEVFTPFAGSGMDFWSGLVYLCLPPMLLATLITIMAHFLKATPVKGRGIGVASGPPPL